MMMLLHHFFVSFTGCNIRFIGRYLLKVFCLCVIQIEPVCHWIQGKKKVTACSGSFRFVLFDEATRTKNHKNDQREFLKKRMWRTT